MSCLTYRATASHAVATFANVSATVTARNNIGYSNMSFLSQIKSFIHSITTDDHYAKYSEGGRVEDTRQEGERLNNINYTPGLRSSDLQLDSFSSGSAPLPSIDSLWDRIELWIDQEYPELDDSLNTGASSSDLNEFERDISLKLPNHVRQFYNRHDGQFRGGKPTGLIMGLTLLDLESIFEEFTIWSKVADRLKQSSPTGGLFKSGNVGTSAGNSGLSGSGFSSLADLLGFDSKTNLVGSSTNLGSSNLAGSSSNLTGGSNFGSRPGSSSQINLLSSKSLKSDSNSFTSNQRLIPANFIKSEYYYPGWIPILKDHIGNQIAIDLSPGPKGNQGQIIIFGRDFDTKLVISSSFQEFIYNFVNDLEIGNYQIDSNQFNEDMGFLSNSRDDDYMIGDEEEGQGDLCFYDNNKEFPQYKGKLSYIEILRKRALKKYGLSENYQTLFTPKSNSNSNKKNFDKSGPIEGSSGIIGSSKDLGLHKETLIDETKNKSNDFPSVGSEKKTNEKSKLGNEVKLTEFEEKSTKNFEEESTKNTEDKSTKNTKSEESDLTSDIAELTVNDDKKTKGKKNKNNKTKKEDTEDAEENIDDLKDVDL